MNNIIYNNYAVRRYFDDVPDGFYSDKYLSLEEAEKSLKKARETKRVYYSYSIVQHASILGICKFNDSEAYVINFTPDLKVDDPVKITCRNFEELNNCYVFHSATISKKLLDTLKKEYYNRGGVFYTPYHEYERKVLKPIRLERQKDFRNKIVQDIFKHDFREIGKNKWSNKEGVVIKQIDVRRSSMNYPIYNEILDIDYDNKNQKILFSSIFSKYLKGYISQLSDNSFCVPCNIDDKRTYHFTCFIISLI